MSTLLCKTITKLEVISDFTSLPTAAIINYLYMCVRKTIFPSSSCVFYNTMEAEAAVEVLLLVVTGRNHRCYCGSTITLW